MKALKVSIVVLSLILIICCNALSQTKLVMDLSATMLPVTFGDQGNRTLVDIGADITIWLKIYLLNVSDLVGYHVKFSFDKSKLDWTGINYTDIDPYTNETNLLTGGLEVKTLSSDTTTFEIVRSRGQNGLPIKADTMWVATIRFITSSNFQNPDSTKLIWQFGQLELKGQPDPFIISSDNFENSTIYTKFIPDMPVEMCHYSAIPVNSNSVYIDWKTESELNNYGFEIERSSDNLTFRKIGFVEGSGTTSIPCSYSFIDNSLPAGTNFYRIKQVDFNGQFKYTDVIKVKISAPSDYKLYQNYPNPFNPETNIRFDLQKKDFVNLQIYDINGKLVKTLINNEKQAGIFNITWDGKNALGRSVASGVYIYRIITRSQDMSKKMILLK